MVRFSLTFAAIIVAWACLHDLHLIYVEPRHFTVFHRSLLPIENLALLAIQYATVATLGPGLAFGFLAWVAARSGRRARRPLLPVAAGFIAVVLVIEVGLLLVGQRAWSLAKQGLPPIYPDYLYPEETPGVLYTQTVNITAYWAAPLIGTLYLFVIWLTRPHSRTAIPRS